MRVTTTLALLCASFLGQCQAANDYPIVLLHGVAGWGREELGGVKYWGGLYGDLQEDMKARVANSKVFTVAMGPLSSNWDRTCEAFAQIKGEVVDYGIKHASDFKINRFGRDYTKTPLYREWGEINTETGLVNKVHLIGHSMGGIDSRLLTHFLNNGAPLGNDEGDSVLFSGGNDWIASVTTLATPHDGAPAALLLSRFTSLITGIVGFAAGGLGGQLGSSDDPLYDFKLDQFNVTRNEGERFDKYFGRVKSSSLFDENNKNTALWSLNPDGALELNKWVKCVENVHYFSIAASSTYSNFFTDRKHVPNPTQVIVLWPFSFYTGSLERQGSSTKMAITREWWENDGVVSTNTADGPTRCPTCITVAYDGRSLDNQKGKFLYLGKKAGWDHLDITGLGERNIKDFYEDIQDWTLGLKASPPEACTTGNGCNGADWPKPQKGSFNLDAAEQAELTTKVLDPGPGFDECKKLAEACPADSNDEYCAQMNEVYKDCFNAKGDASGATSVAPVLGLVFAFVSLLW